MDSVEQKLDHILKELRDLKTVLKAAVDVGLSEPEAAEVMGVSLRYLQGLREAGEIRPVEIGGSEKKVGRVIYSRDTILDFWREHRKRIP